MTYTLHAAGMPGIIRDADRASIPADPANRDWEAYQAWLVKGGVPNPAPPPPPPPVPQSVMMWQLQAVLERQGLATKVQAAVTAAAASNRMILGLWQSLAMPIARTSPTLLALVTAVGMTPAQVDALFIAAAAVQL